MNQENLQLNRLPPSHSPRLTTILISVVITAAIIGSSIYLWHNMKFKKEIGEKSNKGKIEGDYQWEDTTLQSQYSNVLWNKITTNVLTKFSPNTSLTEKKTEDCGARSTDSYLHIEGGLCRVGFWLEDSSGYKIDSLKKLSEHFAPVESEAEAASFAFITHGDLYINESGVPEGHTLVINDGFLVQLVYQNTFGCGSHEPIGVIFKISKNGEIRQLAFEKQKPLKPGESGLCVD